MGDPNGVRLNEAGPANAAEPTGYRDPRSDLSFAAYLAQFFVAKKGYRPGTVPEAQPLADACDYTVTKSDGLTFSIICIVDASRDMKRQFTLGRDDVIAVAKLCRKKYAGRVSLSKMPVTVEIIEVRHRVTPEDLARLKPLRSRMNQIVGAFAVDLSKRKVQSNFWALYDLRGRMIEKALTAPRLNAADLAPPPQSVAPEESRKPLLTLGMLALLVAVYLLEVKFPADGAASGEPSISTLIAFGGLMRPLVVEQGEWYRLLTAPLLHGGAEHIIFNAVAFWFSASVLERLLGRVWLIALFFVGALGGSVMSLVINAPDIVSVGASGAIMCLIAAAFLVSFRSRLGSRRGTQFLMLRMLIPSLIPLAAESGGGGIDYGAHFGGAIVGLVVGGLILKVWPRSEAAPRLAPLARAIAVVGAIAFTGAGYEAYAAHGSYSLGAALIPESEMPKTDAEITARSKDLVRAYPKDPRAHFLRALAVMDTDPMTAERELRAALSQRQALALFNAEFEAALAAYLSRVLITEGRSDEARLTAKPYCHAGPNGSVPEDLAPLNLCSGQ